MKVYGRSLILQVPMVYALVYSIMESYLVSKNVASIKISRFYRFLILSTSSINTHFKSFEAHKDC